jgi:hypothetical protein
LLYLLVIAEGGIKKKKGFHNWQKLSGTFLKCRGYKKFSHRVMEPNLGPLHVVWKLMDWTCKMIIFPSGPWRNIKASDSGWVYVTQRRTLPSETSSAVIRHFSELPLDARGSFTGPTKSKKAPISYRLNTTLQKKEYFCADPQLDFSGRCSCFRTFRCMTNDPHQEQMGAGFLSLKVELPVFWLGGRSPQEGLIKKCKRTQ